MRNIDSIAAVPRQGTALLYLSTAVCRYCALTKEALRTVGPDLGDVDLVHLDGDDDPDAIASLGARTYPQLVLYRDGERVAQRESADEPTLRSWLAENGIDT